MKFVFLDIDGCLKTEYDKFNQKSMQSLREIIVRTGASIVLSSGWRLYFDDNLRPLSESAERLVEELKVNGLEITDKLEGTETEELKNSSINEVRTKQIQDYLRKHYYESYLVIDDLELGCNLTNNQVVVKHSKGLNWRDIKKAVHILGSK